MFFYCEIISNLQESDKSSTRDSWIPLTSITWMWIFYHIRSPYTVLPFSASTTPTHACVHMCTRMTVHMYPVHPCTHVCMYRRAQALMYTHVNPKAHSIHIDTHTHNSINRQGKDSWIHTELVQCRDCKVRGSKEATALGSLCHPPPHLPFPQSAPSGGRGCHSWTHGARNPLHA